MKLAYLSFITSLVFSSCGNSTAHYNKQPVSLGENTNEIRVATPANFDTSYTIEDAGFSFCEAKLKSVFYAKIDSTDRVVVSSPLHFDSEKCSYINTEIDDSFLGQLVQYYRVKNIKADVNGEIIMIDEKPCVFISIQNAEGKIDQAILKTFLGGRMIEVQYQSSVFNADQAKELFAHMEWM